MANLKTIRISQVAPKSAPVKPSVNLAELISSKYVGGKNWYNANYKTHIMCGAFYDAVHNSKKGR